MEMEDGSTLVRRVIENRKRIAALVVKRDEILKQKQHNREKIENSFRRRIDELKAEQTEALRRAEEPKDTELRENQREINSLEGEIYHAKRVLDFLRLKVDEDLSIRDDMVQSGYCKAIVDERFYKVKLFIVENNKPKNKYSLVALGRAILHEPLLKLPKNSGVPFLTQGRYDVETVIREGPSIAELKQWLGYPPNEEDLRRKLKGDYDSVEREYLEVLENYKAQDFQALAVAECKTCGFFHTDLDGVLHKPGEEVKCTQCSRPMTILARV